MQLYESVQPLKESEDTPAMITSLKPNEIFVFGSNEGGKHAGGAAKIAMKWGAEWGNGVGIQGHTYAIPTLDEDFEMIDVRKIGDYVADFIEFARKHPKLHFWVTEIGTGIAGYTHAQIAPLFKKAINVPNISLPLKFKELI